MDRQFPGRVAIFIYIAPMLFAFSGGNLRAQFDAPAVVRYAEAKTHSLSSSVRLPGSVSARTTSTVAAQLAGLVIGFPLREGQKVEEGQVLGRLRTDALELDLRAARAELAESESGQKLSELKWRRAKELFDQKVFSQQELDNAFYDYEARGSRTKRLEASIAQLEDRIEKSVIYAPFDGVIVAEHTQIGEWVTEGGPVVELQAIDDLEIVVQVPERYFATLNRKARATVEIEALPDFRLQAPIRTIIPRADEQARTFPLKIAVPNPRGKLGAGMVAQVTLALGSTRSVIMVPKDAVLREGPSEYVYVLNQKGSVDRVAVRTGTGLGAWVEIESDIKPGQRVVTRGNERLRPGQEVQAEPMGYELP